MLSGTIVCGCGSALGLDGDDSRCVGSISEIGAENITNTIKAKPKRPLNNELCFNAIRIFFSPCVQTLYPLL